MTEVGKKIIDESDRLLYEQVTKVSALSRKTRDGGLRKFLETGTSRDQDISWQQRLLAKIFLKLRTEKISEPLRDCIKDIYLSVDQPTKWHHEGKQKNKRSPDFGFSVSGTTYGILHMGKKDQFDHHFTEALGEIEKQFRKLKIGEAWKKFEERGITINWIGEEQGCSNPSTNAYVYIVSKMAEMIIVELSKQELSQLTRRIFRSIFPEQITMW